MRTVTLILFILAGVVKYGMCYDYPARTIVSTQRRILRINSDGSVNVRFDRTAVKPTVVDRYSNISVRDTDGHLLMINTDGSVNVKGN